MARMTKKLVSKIKNWTDSCYKESLLAVYPAEFSDISINKLTGIEMKLRLIDAGLDYRSEEVDREYIHRVCKLTTEQLQLIIEAHTKKKFMRAPATLDRIMNELLERELHSDHS